MTKRKKSRPKNTEPWWVCNQCNRPVQKVGKSRGLLEAEGGHRKVCPGACYSIEQVPQGTEPVEE